MHVRQLKIGDFPLEALSTQLGRKFIRLSVHLTCLQHVRRDVARRAGLSAAADTCMVILRNRLSHISVNIDKNVSDLSRRTQILYTVSQKKFPPFNCLQLCQILTDFQQICASGKHVKFATRPIRYYSPHLRHAATLPWKSINSIFLQMWKKTQTDCICQSPLTLLFIHKF